MNRINLLQSSRAPRIRESRLRSGNGHSKPTATIVEIRIEDVVIPTYLPAPPDKNPMFLEKRVYQGSSGKIYPLPFTDRISERPVDRKWKAIWIENEFIRAMVLPEIGGRIHVLQDKTNGYDTIYRQSVIKPALVGLAGPWISGGIEFNWPQHHRPATFLPVDFEIEEHADGSRTIWCSDHDPLFRMKGMHGVCLHPGRAYLELKVRAYNRTPFVQTFLWWANVATRVHEGYQSFFPPDVCCVADHARRSMSAYPLCRGHYYGINYAERARTGVPANEIPTQFVPPHCRPKSKIKNQKSKNPNYAPNDLSFYANIPVPTSYMCMGSKEDFFGGYDHAAQAGIVHYANHHISPGKKQWTWGNHDFGYAWDRNLTDADHQGEFPPYIEIMAGVYTDNQPDFSFLQPGETKSWSQYWYPIQKIGPAQHANLDAAVSLLLDKKSVRIGVSVTRAFPRAVVRLERNGSSVEWDVDLKPGRPFVVETRQARRLWKTGETTLRVLDREGQQIISYQPSAGASQRFPLTPALSPSAGEREKFSEQRATPPLPRRGGEGRGEGADRAENVPPPATEPPEPADIASADELYITGLHIDQYRHATRSPVLYWSEALRRDPLDSRCNNALGVWHLRRGEFAEAEAHFRKAISRLTRRNANPYDGEAHYNLGLCLRYLDRADEAYDALYKATWNQGWACASYHTLAEIDCARGDWTNALDHLSRSLRFDTDNLRARNLKVIVLRKHDQTTEATSLLQQTLRLDPLDWWARHLAGEKTCCDLQTCLDVAHDYARAGFYAEAIKLLAEALSLSPSEGERAGVRGVSLSSASPASTGQTLPTQNLGALPIVHYTIGWLEQKRSNKTEALNHFQQAAAFSPDYCFPARLEEVAVLETAMRANPKDARAPYYLGNLLYDRRRHEEAISLWEHSAKLDPNFSVVWRNLGIGHFNIRKQPGKARAAYEHACRANPTDARLLFERDQLWKRLREKPARRLRELSKRLELVQQRDDLSLDLCSLYNQTGQHDNAAQLLVSRKFQPWEGGEGGPLGQYVRSQLALGRDALAKRDFVTARGHFERALESPCNLSEARHLLANQSDVHYWLGCACAAEGDTKSARCYWSAAANFKGDFQEMSVRTFSEMTFYSARSLEKLGQGSKAAALFCDLLAFGRRLQKQSAKIDYFATSLPTMLLFDDDLQSRQEATALFLQAQAHLGLGRKIKARAMLQAVLHRDPNHALAADFLRELES